MVQPTTAPLPARTCSTSGCIEEARGGTASPDFEEALRDRPDIRNVSLYGMQLEPWLQQQPEVRDNPPLAEMVRHLKAAASEIGKALARDITFFRTTSSSRPALGTPGAGDHG